MTGERMFSFITKTWNPIAGGCEVDRADVPRDEVWACPFRCSYCWARTLINEGPFPNLKKKYGGPFRISETAIEQRFKPTDFVFVQDMSDIGAPGIPRSVIIEVFEAIRFWEGKGTRFLLLTKNPAFYRDWKWNIPEETTLGATIETDIHLSPEITLAPDPMDRIEAMHYVKDNLRNDRFICIEPIMKFSRNFDLEIQMLRPKRVAVGYDNYGNGLPEPTLEETEKLILSLEEKGIEVHRKTIREAWA